MHVFVYKLLAGDTDIFAYSSGTLSQSDCSIWYHQSKDSSGEVVNSCLSHIGDLVHFAYEGSGKEVGCLRLIILKSMGVCLSMLSQVTK